LLKEKFEVLDHQLKEQQEINNKYKVDYEHQHFHLVDRDENIRLLKIDLEQQKQSFDERYSLSLKQQQQLSALLEIKTNENKNLIEINQQLKNDLKENHQLLFEKTKQADDLDRQLQIITNEYREKPPTNNLRLEFENLQKENEELNQKLQNQTTESDGKIQVSYSSPYHST
jgi:hypothetical protein